MPKLSTKTKSAIKDLAVCYAGFRRSMDALDRAGGWDKATLEVLENIELWSAMLLKDQKALDIEMSRTDTLEGIWRIADRRSHEMRKAREVA